MLFLQGKNRGREQRCSHREATKKCENLSGKLCTSSEATHPSKRFDYTRHIPSGAKRTIEFLAAVNEDCGKADGYDIKVVQQPEHGTIEIVPGSGFAKWPKDAQRAKCNDKRIPGLNVNYKSANGFLGTDEFEIFAMTPSGWAREVHYTIKVR